MVLLKFKYFQILLTACHHGDVIYNNIGIFFPNYKEFVSYPKIFEISQFWDSEHQVGNLTYFKTSTPSIVS